MTEPDQILYGPIDVEKNGRGEILRFAVERFKGNIIFSIRTYYKSRDGQYRPARGGFGARIDALTSVIRSVTALEAGAIGLGLIEGIAPAARRCADCGGAIEGGRADARFCSSRCRAKASRARRCASPDDPHAAHGSAP